MPTPRDVGMQLGPESDTSPQPLLVEIAPGELLDKITILQIKSARITDAMKLRYVRIELESLRSVREGQLPTNQSLAALTAELRAVNEVLWDVEDAIRRCEAEADFGPRFIELARSVYHENDRRAALKRQVNDLCGARFREEKDYPAYRVAP